MKVGTCPNCNRVHDPHLPCPKEPTHPFDKKGSSPEFKKTEMKARIILILIAIIAMAILIFIGLNYKPTP